MLEVVLERIRLTSKCLKMRHVVLVSKRISSVFSPPVSLSFVCFDEYSLPAAVRRFFYCGGGRYSMLPGPSPPPPKEESVRGRGGEPTGMRHRRHILLLSVYLLPHLRPA